jgi:hypothetical protein
MEVVMVVVEVVMVEMWWLWRLLKFVRVEEKLVRVVMEVEKVG